MDLPVIGAHCSFPSCNELDLLPIQCACNMLFCRKHIRPDAHDCTSLSNTDTPLTAASNPLRRCALAGCSKPAMNASVSDNNDSREPSENTPGACSGCEKFYCAAHRFPTSHSCSPAEVSEASPSTVGKNARARELLQKNFPQALVAKGTSSSAQSNRVGKTSAAQAQIKKVQFMKMRQTARPGDPKTPSLPPAERHHVLVKFEETGAEKTLWFNKSISTGRVLDLLANHFSIIRSDKNPLQMHIVSDSFDEETVVSLVLDRPLSMQTENGCKLLIKRGSNELSTA